MVFYKYPKQYRQPCALEFEEMRRMEESFLLQNRKRRGEKKMIYEVDSLMMLPLQNCQIIWSYGQQFSLFTEVSI